MKDSAIRLVAFDLDGTLLSSPTVCEVLASQIGTSETHAAIRVAPSIRRYSASDKRDGWVVSFFGHGPSYALSPEGPLRSRRL